MSIFGSDRKKIEAERRAVREQRARERQAGAPADDAPTVETPEPSDRAPRARKPRRRLPGAMIVVVLAGASLVGAAAVTKLPGGDIASTAPRRTLSVELTPSQAAIDSWPRFFSCLGLGDQTGIVVATLRGFGTENDDLAFPGPLGSDGRPTTRTIQVVVPADDAEADANQAREALNERLRPEFTRLVEASALATASPAVCGGGNAPPPAAMPIDQGNNALPAIDPNFVAPDEPEVAPATNTAAPAATSNGARPVDSSAPRR